METRPSSIRSSRGRGAPSAIWVIEELAAEDRKAGMLPGRQQTDCLFPQQRHKGMVIPMVLFEPHNNTGRRNPPPWHSVSSHAKLLGVSGIPCTLAPDTLLFHPLTHFPPVSLLWGNDYISLRFGLAITFSRSPS